MSEVANAETFGKLAFTNGKPISANPYDEKAEYHAWRRGWYAGELAANLAKLATMEPGPKKNRWGGFRHRPYNHKRS